MMSFRFAALNYQLQHRVVYQYKLEGYDRDWMNADKTRKVNYSDVPAGTYRFMVKAFLLESPEAYDMRTIEVVIPPYFIFSSGAVWLYMILIAAGLLFGLWWYQEKLRKQHAGSTVPAASVSKENTETKESTEPVQEEEKTDEYVIIED
jgi:hypothetical protein